MATKKTTTEPADAAVKPEDFDPAAKGKKDPVGEAKEPEKAETMPSDNPREPYPTGGGRDPEADFEAAHGFKRAKE